MKTRFSIQIKGKVQGVFYRASAQQKAQELNLVGYAQNQPDGSVFIEAEGDPIALDAFVEWCRQGPPHAKVASVEVTEGALMNYTEFKVRR